MSFTPTAEQIEKVKSDYYRELMTKPSNPYKVASDNPLRNSSFSSSNTFKSSLSSSASSLSRAFFPAYLTFEGVKAMTSVGLDMYDEKFKELGLGKYSEAPVNPVPDIPYPVEVDSVKPISYDVPEGSTLIDVLHGSMIANSAIARQLENSNNIAIHNSSDFNKLVEIISLQGEIDVAYREVELENSLNISKSISDLNEKISSIKELLENNRDIETAYSEQNLSNFDSLLSSLENISMKVSSVASVIDNGIHIEKTEDEINLTSKQLEHINFETTPIQLDNLGDEIPVSTPQQMRAIKDAVVAKKNSDENTFSLDDDDIFDIFDGMPDITSIFSYSSKTSRLPTSEELLQ